MTAKLYEVAHYITPVHYNLLCHTELFSEPFYEKLSKKDQEILTKAGIEATKYIRKWTVDHQQKQLNFLKSHKDIKFNTPPNESLFKKPTVNNWPNFYKQIGNGDEARGKELVTEAAAIAKGTRAKFSKDLFLK